MSLDPDALYAEVVQKYADHLNPGLARLMAFAGFGVEMRGEGCYIYDHEGRQFLDCLGGYGTFALGHRHPKVVEAVVNQLGSLGMSGKAFFSKPAADLAEALAEIAPGNLQYTFFSNSGTEAVEAALKFAKIATERSKIVSTIGGYHGKTIGALSVTGREKFRLKFEPLMPGAEFVPFNDLEAATKAIDDRTAAFIVEPMQGEGGIHIPSQGYLTELKRLCESHGALLIADEVQTCIGRTGKMFGCDHDGVVPDILTMAKQLGGGVIPIGATMGSEELWHKVFSENPMIHTSTFGGNPVACAAGLAAVNVVRDENLVELSAEMGAYMLSGLQSVAGRQSEFIKEARGKGLMIGVEFTMDEVGELTIAQMMKRGLCAAYTLNNPRVMRFEPPLIISREQVDFAVEMFEDALVETKEMLVSLT